MVHGSMIAVDFVLLNHNCKPFIGKTVKILGLIFENNNKSCEITLVDPFGKTDVSICVMTKKILCSHVNKNGYYVFGGLLSERNENGYKKLILDAYMVRSVKTTELETYKNAKIISNYVHDKLSRQDRQDNLTSLRASLRYSLRPASAVLKDLNTERNVHDAPRKGSVQCNNNYADKEVSGGVDENSNDWFITLKR